MGAHGAGKTTLTESMLFEAGLINRRGTIAEGNTVSDFQRIEKERGMSVFTTLVHTEWRNYKINILDTPGLDDFIGESRNAHPPFYPLPALPRSKKGEADLSASP